MRIRSPLIRNSLTPAWSDGGAADGQSRWLLTLRASTRAISSDRLADDGAVSMRACRRARARPPSAREARARPPPPPRPSAPGLHREARMGEWSGVGMAGSGRRARMGVPYWETEQGAVRASRGSYRSRGHHGAPSPPPARTSPCRRSRVGGDRGGASPCAGSITTRSCLPRGVLPLLLLAGSSFFLSRLARASSRGARSGGGGHRGGPRHRPARDRGADLLRSLHQGGGRRRSHGARRRPHGADRGRPRPQPARTGTERAMKHLPRMDGHIGAPHMKN